MRDRVHLFSGEPACDEQAPYTAQDRQRDYSAPPPLELPSCTNIALGARGVVTMFNRFYGSF